MTLKKAFLGLAVLAIVLIGGLTLASTPTTTASAAANDGATVVNDHQCFDWGGGYTVCFDQHGVYNVTTAASGNVNVVGNGTSQFVLTDGSGNVVISLTYDFHYHLLYQAKSGTIQEEGDKFSQTYSFGTYSCTISARFHYANGAVQYSDINFVCS